MVLPHHGSDIAQHDQCLQANSVWNVDLGNAANAYQQLPEISKVKVTPKAKGASESRFTGVVRKRAKTYVITGIDLDSNEQGLHDFLTYLDIMFRSAKFIYYRRVDCQVAQIVIDSDQAELVEHPDTWPEGMICRPWMKPGEYRTRQDHVRERRRDNNVN